MTGFFATLRMTETRNVTGPFAALRVTRTRNVQNDGDAECNWVLQPYGLQDDEDDKKKKTSLSVGLLFCGCQDSNLEPFGS